jgi:hypothetical protein
MSVAIGLMACFLDGKYTSQIIGCKETWCKEAEQLNVPVVFLCGKNQPSTAYQEQFGVKDVHHYPIEDDYQSATHKQNYGLRHMLENYKADYYCIAGTDNYINVDRLIQLCKKYPPETALIIGGYGEVRSIGYQCYFPLGGGGLIFTRAAAIFFSERLEAMATGWTQLCKLEAAGYEPACDLQLGHYAWKWNIPLVREKNLYMCSWTGRAYKFEVIPIGGIDYENIVICHFMERDDMHCYQHYKEKIGSFIQMLENYRKSRDKSLIYFQNDIMYHVIKGIDSILFCNRADVSDHCPHWTFLRALVENYSRAGRLIQISEQGFDLTVAKLAQALGQSYSIIPDEDDSVSALQPVDLLYLNVEKNYGQLKRMLNRYAKLVSKRIIIMGIGIANLNSDIYNQDLTAMVEKTGISREELVLGLGFAIESFILSHPEFVVETREDKGIGIVILKRV